MSAIERMLNRLEEKILVRSDEVTGKSWGILNRERAWAAVVPYPCCWRGFSETASIAEGKPERQNYSGCLILILCFGLGGSSLVAGDGVP